MTRGRELLVAEEFIGAALCFPPRFFLDGDPALLRGGNEQNPLYYRLEVEIS